MNDSERAWIDRFIRHLEVERRLSALTCKHYRRDLEALAGWTDKAGIDRWDALDSEHFRQWSAATFRGGMSSKSIQRRLSEPAWMPMEVFAEKSRSDSMRLSIR